MQVHTTCSGHVGGRWRVGETAGGRDGIGPVTREHFAATRGVNEHPRNARCARRRDWFAERGTGTNMRSSHLAAFRKENFLRRQSRSAEPSRERFTLAGHPIRLYTSMFPQETGNENGSAMKARASLRARAAAHDHGAITIA